MKKSSYLVIAVALFGVAREANAGINTWVNNNGQWWDWTILDCRVDIGTGGLAGSENARNNFWNCLRGNAQAAINEGWNAAKRFEQGAKDAWAAAGKKLNEGINQGKKWVADNFGAPLGCKVDPGKPWAIGD